MEPYRNQQIIQPSQIPNASPASPAPNDPLRESASKPNTRLSYKVMFVITIISTILAICSTMISILISRSKPLATESRPKLETKNIPTPNTTALINKQSPIATSAAKVKNPIHLFLSCPVKITPCPKGEKLEGSNGQYNGLVPRLLYTVPTGTKIITPIAGTYETEKGAKNLIGSEINILKIRDTKDGIGLGFIVPKETIPGLSNQDIANEGDVIGTLNGKNDTYQTFTLLVRSKSGSLLDINSTDDGIEIKEISY